MTASLAGLALIVLTMVIYYRWSGINAVVALLLNTILTLAALIVFDATLTLPGIAGIILGIGMAVDSNVLIFERIREELQTGKTVASAIDVGFDRAFVTIIDTHVTTIVSSRVPLRLRDGSHPRLRRHARARAAREPVYGRLRLAHHLHVGPRAPARAAPRRSASKGE